MFIRHYVRLCRAGVALSLGKILMMSLRRSLSGELVEAIILAHEAELSISPDQLEMLSLAGGHVRDVVLSAIALHNQEADVPWERLSAIDLAGLPVATVTKTYLERRKSDPELTIVHIVMEINREANAEQSGGE